MERRSFLKTSVAAGAGFAAAPNVVTAATRKRFRWRMVLVVPKHFRFGEQGFKSSQKM